MIGDNDISYRQKNALRRTGGTSPWHTQPTWDGYWLNPVGLVIPYVPTCSQFIDDRQKCCSSHLRLFHFRWGKGLLMTHSERHRTERIGWLRAAVLGADDGIVSIASLVVGIATAGSPRQQILLAGVAGLVAGALSMAAGEYVSVSSQSDTEEADLATERAELARQRPAEEKELAAIYVRRGLDPELARTVALQLMAHDALAAHARDELGITEEMLARPLQAAAASAATFAVGAVLPLLVAMFAPLNHLPLIVSAASLLCLAALGTLAARTGGASPWIGGRRVAFWGALAMAATAGIGKLFGTTTP